MPVLWKVFDFFATNKTAQWVLAIVSGLFLYKTYERLRDMRIRKQAKEAVIEKIEAKEDKLKEQANEAENAVTRDLNERSLRNVAAGSPENLGLCAELTKIEFHAPLEPMEGDWWPDTADNTVDTPETVERILKHNAKLAALCPNLR